MPALRARGRTASSPRPGRWGGGTTPTIRRDVGELPKDYIIIRGRADWQEAICRRRCPARRGRRGTPVRASRPAAGSGFDARRLRRPGQRGATRRTSRRPRHAAADAPARRAPAVPHQRRPARRARGQGDRPAVRGLPAGARLRAAGHEGHRFPRPRRRSRPAASPVRPGPADRRVPRLGPGRRRAPQPAAGVPGRRRGPQLHRRRLPRVLPDAARPGHAPRRADPVPARRRPEDDEPHPRLLDHDLPGDRRTGPGAGATY